MGEPGFWDDPEAAGRVGSEHARETRRLTTYEQLASDVDDLEGLVELAEEDPELAAEVEEAFGSVETRLEALEEERLFSGPYDARRRARRRSTPARAAPTPRTGPRWCCGC